MKLALKIRTPRIGLPFEGMTGLTPASSPSTPWMGKARERKPLRVGFVDLTQVCPRPFRFKRNYSRFRKKGNRMTQVHGPPHYSTIQRYLHHKPRLDDAAKLVEAFESEVDTPAETTEKEGSVTSDPKRKACLS